jgi:hypothetical protein
MSYRAPQELTVRWDDGFTWKAEPAVFDRVTRALAALREVIVGLGPVLDRWEALAARSPELRVDEFAPAEDDRAVFTAALARALEDARAEAAGDDEARAAYVDSLGALHELFVTDITKRG